MGPTLKACDTVARLLRSYIQRGEIFPVGLMPSNLRGLVTCSRFTHSRNLRPKNFANSYLSILPSSSVMISATRESIPRTKSDIFTSVSLQMLFSCVAVNGSSRTDIRSIFLIKPIFSTKVAQNLGTGFTRIVPFWLFRKKFRVCKLWRGRGLHRINKRKRTPYPLCAHSRAARRRCAACSLSSWGTVSTHTSMGGHVYRPCGRCVSYLYPAWCVSR